MDKISFWKLLSDFDVIIPIIQRDYAQGREGKEYIREKFLEQINHALKDDQKRGELDFVYGTMIQQRFYPLDGQQRLTTLWLLHWFVASKAKMLNDDTKKFLKKFSYETRTSSREFCEKLCDYCGDVADIQSQTWFYATWKQDPTIQSMLRMLETMKTYFKEDYVDDYKDLWGKLVDTNCPLKFSKLEITSKELPVSDDLYIKMNARGKPLTDFENLKADLISGLDDKCKVKYGPLIDNAWTNHFWNKDEIGLFDTKWMAFLCRIAVCLKFEKDVNLKKTNEAIATQLKEWNIYTKDVEGFSYVYTGFLDFNDVIDLERLEKVFKGWEKLIKINGFSLASSWGETFDFIPSRKEGANALSPLTMKGKVLFYGTIRFCEEICKECNAFANLNLKEKWDEWKRIMWNLAENTNEASTLEGFVGVMKLFNQLSHGCVDIHNYLNENSEKLESEFKQLKEEIEKIKQIKSDEYKDVILEAEKFTFFKGAIRFLYRTEDNQVDWCNVKDKFKTAKGYFSENGLKDYPRVNQVVISFCNDWNLQLRRRKLFGKKAETWKSILLNEFLAAPIHHLLMGEDVNQCLDEEVQCLGEDGMIKEAIKKIAKNEDNIWDKIKENAIDNYQFEWQWNAPCVWLSRYPSCTIRICDNFMDKIKASHKNVEFDEKVNYFTNRGEGYHFTYDGQHYIYYPFNENLDRLLDDGTTEKMDAKKFFEA